MLRCLGFVILYIDIAPESNLNDSFVGTFFPDLPGYDSPGLVSMGKCPKCNCEQIWEANCNQAGSVDKICTSLCNGKIELQMYCQHPFLKIFV